MAVSVDDSDAREGPKGRKAEDLRAQVGCKGDGAQAFLKRPQVSLEDRPLALTRALLYQWSKASSPQYL